MEKVRKVSNITRLLEKEHTVVPRERSKRDFAIGGENS